MAQFIIDQLDQENISYDRAKNVFDYLYRTNDSFNRLQNTFFKNTDYLVQIIQKSKTRTYNQSEIVYLLNEKTIDEYYIILDGSVSIITQQLKYDKNFMTKICLDMPQALANSKGVLETGQQFNEKILISQPKEQQETILCLSQTVLLVIRQQDFKEQLNKLQPIYREKKEYFLQQIPLLSELDTYPRQRLIYACEEFEYKKDFILTQQNKQGQYIYFIKEGTCMLQKSLMIKNVISKQAQKQQKLLIPLVQFGQNECVGEEILIPIYKQSYDYDCIVTSKNAFIYKLDTDMLRQFGSNLILKSLIKKFQKKNEHNKIVIQNFLNKQQQSIKQIDNQNQTQIQNHECGINQKELIIETNQLYNYYDKKQMQKFNSNKDKKQNRIMDDDNKSLYSRMLRDKFQDDVKDKLQKNELKLSIQQRRMIEYQQKQTEIKQGKKMSPIRNTIQKKGSLRQFLNVQTYAKKVIKQVFKRNPLKTPKSFDVKNFKFDFGKQSKSESVLQRVYNERLGIETPKKVEIDPVTHYSNLRFDKYKQITQTDYKEINQENQHIQDVMQAFIIKSPSNPSLTTLDFQSQYLQFMKPLTPQQRQTIQSAKIRPTTSDHQLYKHHGKADLQINTQKLSFAPII